MTLDDEIWKIKKERNYFADTYLRSICDFCKWTTSLSLASILVVGNSFLSFKGISQNLAFISIFLLLGSVYFSISLFYLAIRYWSMNWQSLQVLDNLFSRSWSVIEERVGINSKNKMWSEIKELIDSIKIDDVNVVQLKQKMDEYNQFENESRAQTYDKMLKIHLYLLFVGVVFYFAAIIFNH